MHHDKESMKNNFTQCWNQISSLDYGQEIKFKINEKDDFLMFLLKWCEEIMNESVSKGEWEVFFLFGNGSKSD